MIETVNLYADDGGTGSLLPVLFSHSTAGNASQWSAQLERLHRNHRGYWTFLLTGADDAVR